MRLASEKHRGFWELANLMTRPTSQADAIDRWSKKPIDVQLDVVDALPCGSEVFLAQLAALARPDALVLRAACEARTHAETASCSTAFGARADLVDAVAIRRLSVKCRADEVFVSEARRWSATKPEAIALAATRRLPLR